MKTRSVEWTKPDQRIAMEGQHMHPSELLEFKTVTADCLYATNSKDDACGQPALSKSLSFKHVESTNDPGTPLHRSQTTLDASKYEHGMTFSEGFKLYPKAVCWSALLSLAIVMEGYDTALISSFFAFDEFRKTYGVLVDGEYQITAKWQASLSNASVVGSIIGLFANGVLTERFGYRPTMIGALVALAACIFLPFFASNIETLLAGQVTCGISWGIFSTLTTTYAAEVVPLNLRVYLTANVNLCWLIGQVIAVGILRGLLTVQSTWSYRIPFGLQWAWIFGLLVVAYLAPESPWWLVRMKRLADAERMLLRLARRGFDYNVKSVVAMMDFTNSTEKQMNGNRERDLSYMQCFRGINLRRTEIACMIFVIQNICGLPVIAFAAYFYSRLGFDQKRSFDLTLALQGIALLGAMLSIPLMKYFGRRTLYIGGLLVQTAILLAAGIVSSFKETTATLWATASLILAFIFVFDSAVGPLTYCLVAEIPSTRLRVKTVVLARVSYNLSALITNPLQTKMLNPLVWDWRGKSCYFWAASSALCVLYCYFRLPETKGLTYLELDILFDKRATAKQFSTLQEKLAETGYFSFNHQEGREPQWTEIRRSATTLSSPS